MTHFKLIYQSNIGYKAIKKKVYVDYSTFQINKCNQTTTN